MASMKNTPVPLTVFLLLLCLFFGEANAIKYSTDANVKKACTEGERKALLDFKHGLKDPSGRLSSWGVGDDCCKWRGVDCSDQTRNVVKVDLGNRDYMYSKGLGGEISDSLLHLKHLNYLDLSFNDFQGIQIPDFLGSFERLRYLNLCFAGFGGMIPPHLGNLSHLRYLDLCGGTEYQVGVSNLKWLSGLSSLKYLDLGNVNLRKAATNWKQAVNMLPSLLQLYLPSCELGGFPQYYSDPNSFVNLTSLMVVDLSYNNFNTTLPAWLFNISASLRGVYLRDARVKGPIPHVNWQSRQNLVTLDLSSNEIGSEGIIELVNGLSICCNNSLEELYLSDNGLSGELPDSLGNFKNLISLDLSFNSFDGPFPNVIQRLTNLEILDLRESSLSGPIPMGIGNMLRMKRLDLAANLTWRVG